MKIPLVVVDDDETDRYLVKRAAQSLNYDFEIIEFETGSLFVETVLDPEKRVASLGVPPPPILVLLDINMPKLSGLNWLKSMPSTPNVIITTAYPEFALEGYELSVIDYLLKPFSLQRFLKAVAKVQDRQNVLPVKEEEKKQGHKIQRYMASALKRSLNFY